jgi:hypothetical protein
VDKPKMTKEKLRRVALSDNVLTQVLLGSSPVVLFDLLRDMGVAMNTRKDLVARKRLSEIDILLGRALKGPPEHDQFHESLDVALKQVEEAFEAVLDASWNFLQITEECECAGCRRRRQREEADMS